MPTCIKFEDLSIWLIARELCKDIYRITKYEDFKVSIHHFINYLKNSQYKGQKYKP